MSAVWVLGGFAFLFGTLGVAIAWEAGYARGRQERRRAGVSSDAEWARVRAAVDGWNGNVRKLP